MEKSRLTLTEAEWQVMECLWQSAPASGREVCETMEKARGWSRSTTLTLIRRMEAKSAVGEVEGLAGGEVGVEVGEDDFFGGAGLGEGVGGFGADGAGADDDDFAGGDGVHGGGTITRARRARKGEVRDRGRWCATW